MKRTLPGLALASWVTLVASGACSSQPQADGADSADAEDRSDSAGGVASFTGGRAATGGGSSSTDDGLSSSGGSLGVAGDGNTTTCETASQATDLAPLYLAFAFDVSGSMGKLDRPRWWHDPEAKWKPVVTATRAFFENTNLERLNASMALFPAEDDDCDTETYVEPTVAMTELPSMAFGEALVAYEEEVGDPLAGGDWRGGTPTFAALSGTARSLDALREAEPDAAFAVVLVTDGLPQGCDEGLEETVEAARELADSGLRTYVIGIQNPVTPPGELPEGWDDWGDCDDGGGDEPCPPPDTLEALNQIAEAGESGTAFLIDTNDPSATEAAFSTAIDAIRESSFSCSLPIPPNPMGGTFEPNFIDVTVKRDGVATGLRFDESCEAAESWHFVAGSSPLELELCPSTCQEIVAQGSAQLLIDFLCEERPVFE